MKHNHYFKDSSKYSQVDVYRVLEMFGVIHPCQQHLAKKALCAGNRGHKDLLRDIQDIIDTAQRWKEMLIEDNTESAPVTPQAILDAQPSKDMPMEEKCDTAQKSDCEPSCSKPAKAGDRKCKCTNRNQLVIFNAKTGKCHDCGGVVNGWEVAK